MAERRVERRLAAILAADVVGYSRLVERDEAGTLARLRTLQKKVIEPLVAEQGGRIVKLIGDGVLCEFGSVVDAVGCAVLLQRELAEREAGTAADQRIRFRIGVNLGDIVLDDGDVYGDGVNVAARLEGIAEPGGIAISGTAYDHLQGKLDCAFAPVGQRRVKNIARPIRVYRVVLDGAAPRPRRRGVPGRAALAAALGLALVAAVGAGTGGWWWLGRQPPAPATAPDAAAALPPLPDKPSIAVLPFDNLSGDERLGRMADGMVEDVIAELSRFRELFVVARSSAFAYKGKARDVRAIGRELGVRYVVEGSVQADGELLRVTVQLIDAATGLHRWSERYDRPLGEMLRARDEVTGSIVATLASAGGAVYQSELDELRRKPEASLSASELLTLGLSEFYAFTREANAQARARIERALELSPDLAIAWRFLGLAYEQLGSTWADDPTEAWAKSHEYCQKAMALDPVDSYARFCVGVYYRNVGEFERARSTILEAVALNPNHANTLAGASAHIAFMGDPARGVELVERALRLNAFPTPYYWQNGANAYFYAGNFEMCVDFRRRLNRTGHVQDRIWLARCFAMLGRTAEAKAARDEALALDPDWSLERLLGAHLLAPGERERDLFLEATRKAGLPVCATHEQLAKYPTIKRLPGCEAERA